MGNWLAIKLAIALTWLNSAADKHFVCTWCFWSSASRRCLVPQILMTRSPTMLQSTGNLMRLKLWKQVRITLICWSLATKLGWIVQLNGILNWQPKSGLVCMPVEHELCTMQCLLGNSLPGGAELEHPSTGFIRSWRGLVTSNFIVFMVGLESDVQ